MLTVKVSKLTMYLLQSLEWEEAVFITIIMTLIVSPWRPRTCTRTDTRTRGSMLLIIFHLSVIYPSLSHNQLHTPLPPSTQHYIMPGCWCTCWHNKWIPPDVQLPPSCGHNHNCRRFFLISSIPAKLHGYHSSINSKYVRGMVTWNFLYNKSLKKLF